MMMASVGLMIIGHSGSSKRASHSPRITGTFMVYILVLDIARYQRVAEQHSHKIIAFSVPDQFCLIYGISIAL